MSVIGFGKFEGIIDKKLCIFLRRKVVLFC